MSQAGTEPRPENRPLRAAILADHPAQHFVRAFQLLGNHPEIWCKVYFWNAAVDGVIDAGFDRHIRWSNDLHSGYDWWSPPAASTTFRRGKSIVTQLLRDRPTVVLCFGWGSTIARLGIVFSLLTRTPILYYGDTHSQYSSSGRHYQLRKLILGQLFRRAAGVISTGGSNRDFYLAHGVDPSRIHPGVYPADIDVFSAGDRDSASSTLGSSNGVLTMGFGGKLIARKAVDDLIEAVSRLPADCRWELWVIGDGPLREDLEVLAARRGVADQIRFLGFKNCDELPLIFSALDILVLSSRRENRGVVAVEAMAAGAAVVVSSATGLWGAGDIVQHGKSGLVYPAGDIDALARCLSTLVHDGALRKRLAVEGRANAQHCGPADFATTTAAALIATTRPGGHRSHRTRTATGRFT